MESLARRVSTFRFKIDKRSADTKPLIRLGAFLCRDKLPICMSYDYCEIGRLARHVIIIIFNCFAFHMQVVMVITNKSLCFYVCELIDPLFFIHP